MDGAAPTAGDNVPAATLRQFERDYAALKTKVDEARGALGARCKQAEADGIDVKTFKQVAKLKALLAPEMDAKVQAFTRYTQQLGLFDLIEEYRQGIEREDNAASVAAAERAETKRRRRAAKTQAMAPADADALTASGGKLEAANAQGVEAGIAGARRESNPYPQGDAHDYWDRGWVGGDRQRRVAIGGRLDG